MCWEPFFQTSVDHKPHFKSHNPAFYIYFSTITLQFVNKHILITYVVNSLSFLMFLMNKGIFPMFYLWWLNTFLQHFPILYLNHRLAYWHPLLEKFKTWVLSTMPAICIIISKLKTMSLPPIIGHKSMKGKIILMWTHS